MFVLPLALALALALPGKGGDKNNMDGTDGNSVEDTYCDENGNNANMIIDLTNVKWTTSRLKSYLGGYSTTMKATKYSH